MNFYIGNSINQIKKGDRNVEFSDELISFIYKIRKYAPVDMRKLYLIDPYDDVMIPKTDLPQIINICKFILESSLLQNYEYRDEGFQMLQDLMEIAKKAITNEVGLISIGD